MEHDVGQSIDMPGLSPVQIDPGTSLVVKYSSAVLLIAVRPDVIQAYAAEPGQWVPGLPKSR